MCSLNHIIGFSFILSRSQLTVRNFRRCLCTKDFIAKISLKQSLQFTETATKQNVNQTPRIEHEKEMQRLTAEEIIDEKTNNYSVLNIVADESKIISEPILRPSFNLSYFVPKSQTLQKLIHLGVDLNSLERRNLGTYIANLDFERDIKAHVLLLTKDIGIDLNSLGHILTQNPYVLRENLDDIQTRINYMQLKRFKPDEIVQIVTRNPFWLNFSVRRIDRRLGYFQKRFDLTGMEVRSVTLTYPKLITSKLTNIDEVYFTVREEFGFEAEQIKELLLKQPKMWTKGNFNVMLNI